MAILLPFENPLVFHFGILATTAGTLVIVLVGRGAQSRLARYRQPLVLTWLAERSYSIYLFHWPLVIIFVQVGAALFPLNGSLASELGRGAFLLLALLLTFLCAELSYRFLEQGFRSGTAGQRSASRARTGAHAHATQARTTHTRPSARPFAGHAGARITLLAGSAAALVLLALSVWALASAPAQTLVDQKVASGYLSLDTARLEAAYHASLAEGGSEAQGLGAGEGVDGTEGGGMATGEGGSSAAGTGTNTGSPSREAALADAKAVMRARVAEGQQACVGGITLLGDSVSLEAVVDCQQQLGPIPFYAEIGQDMYASLGILQTLQASGSLNEYVIVAVAFNSHANSIACVDEILATLEPGHRVVIVTSSDNIGGMDTLSAYLRTLPEAHSFVTVADWAALTRERGDMLAADGYHPATAEATELYASLLFDALAEASLKPSS